MLPFILELPNIRHSNFSLTLSQLWFRWFSRQLDPQVLTWHSGSFYLHPSVFQVCQGSGRENMEKCTLAHIALSKTSYMVTANPREWECTVSPCSIKEWWIRNTGEKQFLFHNIHRLYYPQKQEEIALSTRGLGEKSTELEVKEQLFEALLNHFLAIWPMEVTWPVC